MSKDIQFRTVQMGRRCVFLFECLSTTIFAKPPGTQYVGKHQDTQFWALEPPIAITAWIALQDVSLENGCMELIPGILIEERHRWYKRKRIF